MELYAMMSNNVTQVVFELALYVWKHFELFCPWNVLNKYIWFDFDELD